MKCNELNQYNVVVGGEGYQRLLWKIIMCVWRRNFMLQTRKKHKLNSMPPEEEEDGRIIPVHAHPLRCLEKYE